MTSLRVDRFDLRKIKPNRTILITGKRGTGKTTLLKHMMYMLRDRFDVVLGVGGSQASVDMLESFLPKSMVYNSPRVDVVEKMVQVAKLLIQHGKCREFLLIMDDCTFDKNLFRKLVFREVFMNGRNFRFTFVIAAQYIMDLATDLRSQIDYVFTFQELIFKNRKRLHEYFYGMVDNLRDFEQILKTFTQNYECLVMDNTDASGDIGKQLYYYKAPLDTPPFTMGNGIFWALDTTCQKHAMSPAGTQFYKKLGNVDTAYGAAAASATPRSAANKQQLTIVRGCPTVQTRY